MAHYMVDALFLAGHTDVILDATNTTIARRDEWRDKRWRRKFVPIDTERFECLARAVDNSDFHLVPVINRMADQFEPPTPQELREWEK